MSHLRQELPTAIVASEEVAMYSQKYRKLRLGGSFCNGPRTLKISKTADNKNIPIYLDFDRNRPNTGIRLLVGVPSCLKNSPKFGHFWSYSLGITCVTRFSRVCVRIPSQACYLLVRITLIRCFGPPRARDSEGGRGD